MVAMMREPRANSKEPEVERERGTGVVAPRHAGREAGLCRYVRSAPGTTIYVLVLAISGFGLRLASPTLESQILRDQSTNWHNMRFRPVLSLAASALWIDGDLLVWIPLMVVMLGLAERHFGTWHCFRTFIAGHVGATLVSLVVVWRITRTGTASSEALENTIDIGVSYGFVAVAAGCCVLLPRRWRALVTTGLLAYLGTYVLMSHTFTEVGHLAAAVIGSAIPLRAHRRRSGVGDSGRARR
jgi:hypothetical protein